MRVEVEFDEEDQDKVRRALGSDIGADRIAQIAQMVARAGARECLAQATGEGVFSSMSDLRSFRIFCLLREGMGMSDAEGLVAGLFKVPIASAKRLVSSAIARYAVELDARVTDSMVDLLDGAAPVEGAWDMRMPSAFVRERVSDLLERMDVPPPASAQRGSIWRFPNETYQALRRKFGLADRPAP